MKISHAAIAAVAAAVVGIGGGAAVAQIGRDHSPLAGLRTVTPAPSAAPSATQAPDDKLDYEENLLLERSYFDLTGHSFALVDAKEGQTLSACTAGRTFGDVLPRGVSAGVSLFSSRLIDNGGRHVVEQLAQTGSAQEASAVADEIVALVDECAAITAGDFGYGDPVTLPSGPDRKVVYFPAFNSNDAAGGYVVFSVGPRVGVVDVADDIPVATVARLAEEAATIAAK